MHLQQTHKRPKRTLYHYHTCTVQIQCNDNNNRLFKCKNPGRRGFPRAAAKYENATTSFYPTSCSFLDHDQKINKYCRCNLIGHFCGAHVIICNNTNIIISLQSLI